MTESHSTKTAGPPAKICCPRCGYDQRGVVATWTDSCPIDGICAECGLSFPWAEVLCTEKFEPRWCVEYAPWWSIPRACVRTILRSVLPWRFWTALKMSHRVRPLRLAIYLMFLATVGSLLLYIPIQSSRAIAARHNVGLEYVNYCRSLPSMIAESQQRLQALETMLANPNVSDPDKRRPLFQAECARLKSIIVSYKAQSSTPVAINQSYTTAVIEALLFPFGNTSWGTINFGDGTSIMYPAPGSLVTAADVRWSEPDISPIEQGLISACSGFLFLFFMPLTLILLPATRRRAKVRWVHIWRVAAYGTAIPLFAFVICHALAYSLFYASAWTGAREFMGYGIILVGLIVAGLWALAMRCYLKMPHALLIAALMGLMLTLLLSPCLMMVLPAWIARLIIFR